MTTKQILLIGEILLIGSAPGIDFPSVQVGQSDISFSSAARNVSVIFDSELSLKEQVNKLSTRLSGDQEDQFNLTVSFCGSYQISRFLSCSL